MKQFLFALSAWCLLSTLAAADDRPNILFAISDDQSHAHTSIAGYQAVKTPGFDRVAREGILFTQAYSASPGCSPSRAAILTGRYPWQIEQAGTHASGFPTRYVCYPDLLEAAGYVVGATGKAWGPGNWKVSGRTRNPAGPEFNKLTNDAPPGIRKTDYASNFAEFMKQRDKTKPFCFWYGASEPHRGFKKGIGLEHGKRLEDVVVPPFLPDTPEIRSDILDYCFEIEWFDKHLVRMLDLLEKSGELDNTIVVVTSDNGMSFPRAKANCYEYGIHMPLAIRWAAKGKPGRVVDDLVSLIDLMPTYLEAAGVKHPSEETGELPMSGRSLLNILDSDQQGLVDRDRNMVFSSRERHSSSRWNNLTYPQRSMRSGNYLYIRNFKPERWPAGAPQKYNGDKLGPMHGGYHDIDACPSLSYLIEHRDDEKIAPFFHWAVDRRPAVELFDVSKDPGCLKNLAGTKAVYEVEKQLTAQFEDYLQKTEDPRVLGTGDVWETYKRYSPIRKFPPPDWAQEEKSAK